MEARDRLIAALRSQPGFKAWYDLVDTESNKRVVITFWDSQEAMKASDGKSAIQAGGAPIPANVVTETFEVVAQA